MGHSKTNWERRALKAESDLEQLKPYLLALTERGPSLLMMLASYPLLVQLWDSLCEPEDPEDHTVQLPLATHAILNELNSKFIRPVR